MFSVRQKREISEKIQNVIRETGHPELPENEIQFEIHIRGAEEWCFAIIANNGAVTEPGINPWNEAQDNG